MSSIDQNRGRTNEHVHAHTGITTCDKGHSHMQLGVTSPPISAGLYQGQHYHEISGLTTFDNRHFHYYRATTGPSIELHGRYHTHHFRFRTGFDEGHDHGVEGFVEPTMS